MCIYIYYIYSHWLLCNLFVVFADQYFTDTHYVGRACARSILKNAVPPHFFQVGILGVFEPNFKAIRKVYIPC